MQKRRLTEKLCICSPSVSCSQEPYYLLEMGKIKQSQCFLCSPFLPALAGVLKHWEGWKRLKKAISLWGTAWAASDAGNSSILLPPMVMWQGIGPWLGLFGVVGGFGCGFFLLVWVFGFVFFATQGNWMYLQSGCIVVVIYGNCGCRFVRSFIFIFLNKKFV